MRIVMVAAPKGGVGKSIVTTTGAMSLGRRGVRCAVLDLSQSNPSQQYRSGLASSQPAAFAVPAVADWPMERTTGWRVLEPSPESWSARSFDALVGWMEAAAAAAKAAGIEVLILDFDPLAANPLHVRALEIADDVVIVLDRSTFTLDNAEKVLGELQSPHPQVRNGFPFVGPDRVAFLYCHTGAGKGAPAAAQAALRGRGRWLGALSYSATLDRQGDLARLALACPESVLEEMDHLVANLIPGLPPKPAAVATPRPSRRSRPAAADAVVVVDSQRVLRVFGGPVAPAEMSVAAFQAFTLLEGWGISTVRVLAARVGVREKEMRRTVQELIGLGLVERPNKKESFLAPRPVLSDVRELRELSRQLAGGVVSAERVVSAMRSITGPAYGAGDDPVWAVHHGAGLERGVPLARQAEEVLLGVAEQAALAHAAPEVLSEVAAALARAKVPVPEALSGAVHAPAVRPGGGVAGAAAPDPAAWGAPVVSAGSEWSDPVWRVDDEPTVVEPTVGGGELAGAVDVVRPASLMSAGPVPVTVPPPDPAPAPAPAPSPDQWPVVEPGVRVRERSRGVGEARVLLRVFGHPGEQDMVPSGGSSMLAIPVVLAVMMRAMSKAEVCEMTGYAEGSLRNVFTAGHPLVVADGRQVLLADGVWGEDAWLGELVSRAATQARQGRLDVAADLVLEAHQLARGLTSEPFERVPAPTRDRWGKVKLDTWAWVDEPAPGLEITPRVVVGQRYARSVVGLVTLWDALGGVELLPAGEMVELCVQAAMLVPLIPVGVAVADGWANAGERLLVEGYRVASSSRERDLVRGAAAELIASNVLEHSERLADALGLPR